MAHSGAVRMHVGFIWRLLFGLALVLSPIVGWSAVVRSSPTLGVSGGILFLCSLYVFVIGQSSVAVDSEQLVVVRPPYGTYRLAWHEVTYAARTGSTLILSGSGKALGFITLMGDRQRHALWAATEQHLRQHGIPLHRVARLRRLDKTAVDRTRDRT